MSKLVLAALAALALAGCGGGASDEGPGKPVQGAAAATQIATLVDKLDRALGTYREGDRDKAKTDFDAARAAHYEPVRAAVRRADAALGTRIDTALLRELPRLIDDGVTVTQLARPLASAEADLERAAGELRGT